MSYKKSWLTKAKRLHENKSTVRSIRIAHKKILHPLYVLKSCTILKSTNFVLHCWKNSFTQWISNGWLKLVLQDFLELKIRYLCWRQCFCLRVPWLQHQLSWFCTMHPSLSLTRWPRGGLKTSQFKQVNKHQSIIQTFIAGSIISLLNYAYLWLQWQQHEALGFIAF